MTFNEKVKVYSYLLAKDSSLCMDYEDTKNKYNLRDLDEVDYLESIIAFVRMKTFNEFSEEILNLLNL